MAKRLWLNIVLVVLLGGLVYFIMSQPSQQQQAQQQNRNAQRLFNLASYQVEMIHIQRPNGADIKLQKVNEKWQLLEPARAAVNQDRIKHLLTIVDEPVIAEYELKDKELSTFGLDPGKITLTINEEQAIFGSTNPVTLNRYILKNNKIYTIKEIVYGVLGSSVTNLLTHTVLPEHIKVSSILAPELFQGLPLDFWTTTQAIDIADYVGDETIIGKMTLTLQDEQAIVLDLLSIKPLLVIGRPDLKVKYTFDENNTSELLRTQGNNTESSRDLN